MSPAPDGDTAFAEDEGTALLDAVCAHEPIVALAVSGGPDSMALLHIADLWARRRGRRLLVLTVDHGLRAASAGEAAMVAAAARRRGHAHRTLIWRGEKPASGLQAAARDARLTLLTETCHEAGVPALLMAHHRDDQAETVLHRIARDTGPLGLAGMAVERRWAGLRILRPLLAVGKSRLVATCVAAGLPWVCDPSNEDTRFTRARMRRMRPALDAVGLTVDRLARLARAMGTARSAIDAAVTDWLAEHGRAEPCGTLRIDRRALADLHPVLRHAVLRAALGDVGGAGYPAGADAMAGLDAWIATAGEGRRTLSGCLIAAEPGALTVMREVSACAPARIAHGGQTICWDGRFLLRNASARPVRIGACGEAGWRRLRLGGLPGAVVAAARAVPHAARLAWPLVTDLDGVVALPHLVLGERGTPDRANSGVEVHLLAPRERRIDGPLANGRLTT